MLSVGLSMRTVHSPHFVDSFGDPEFGRKFRIMTHFGLQLAISSTRSDLTVHELHHEIGPGIQSVYSVVSWNDDLTFAPAHRDTVQDRSSSLQVRSQEERGFSDVEILTAPVP